MKPFLLNKSLPRWFILLIDQSITSWSFTLAFFVVKQVEFADILHGHFFAFELLYCLVSLGCFYALRLHSGLIRYSSIKDIYRIFSAVLLTSISYFLIAEIWLTPQYDIDSFNVFLILLVNFFITSSLLIIVRIGAKSMFYFIKRNTSGEKEHYLIYGANGHAILIKQALETSSMGKSVVVGFIDDNPNKINKNIQQVKVYHVKELEKLQQKFRIDKLVVMSEDLKTVAKKQVVSRCIELGIKVQKVPPTDQWMSGSLQMNQMKDLRIEDLLQRAPIVIENDKISGNLAGKRVLVTGGAGSIGSEIVRQVLQYNPAMVIICDQAESPMHELQLEVEEEFPGANLITCIADIQNFDRMYTLFKEYTPEVIYHAAAYKHVPMMEKNPSEAILTNVIGTKNLADLAITFDVERFVMISTDKAVNPTNIMGASKRIAEIYIQSLDNMNQQSANTSATKFITTRFGNVLGSNGSVIPRFRAQIEKGTPITVTHPDITRYFMTIPEAVNLVLEAGTMGNGGEIFIFDMGEPVRIVDLARKMIKLAGLIPDVDVKIVFTGLRPGEKLYEELLNEEELTIPTYHNKIKISKVRQYPYEKVQRDITELVNLNRDSEDVDVVRKMKQIVPEFISKNSRFEKLDLQVK